MKKIQKDSEPSILISYNFMFPCEDSKTLSVCPYPEKRNHPSFVNVSSTLVIDTSMKMSSRVLASYCMETQKFEFFHTSSKLNIDLCRRAEITLAS